MMLIYNHKNKSEDKMEPLKITCQPSESLYHIFLRKLLKIIMIIIGNPNKITYWWNWRGSSIAQPLYSLIQQKDQSENKLCKLKMSLGLWKNMIAIAPKDKSIFKWQIGFKTKSENKLCNIIISGPALLQIGKQDVYFYGLNDKGHQIELEIVKHNYHYPVL